LAVHFHQQQNDSRMPIPVELTVSDGAYWDDEREHGSTDREQSAETTPWRRQKSDSAEGSNHGLLLAPAMPVRYTDNGKASETNPTVGRRGFIPNGRAEEHNRKLTVRGNYH